MAKDFGKSRVKAKIKKDIVTVKVLAKHEMLSNMEADNKNKKKPGSAVANWITYVKATVNDAVVYEVSTSQFLSKNPYFAFKFNAAEVGAKKDDKLVFSWVDKAGNTQSDDAKIK